MINDVYWMFVSADVGLLSSLNAIAGVDAVFFTSLEVLFLKLRPGADRATRSTACAVLGHVSRYF